MSQGNSAMFESSMSIVARHIHNTATEKGWWDDERNDGEIICLMHSELSEGLEALRDGNPASKKIPEFSCVEEEMADTVIRIMDYCKAREFDLAGAMLAKIDYNDGREHKHGGRLF